MGFIPAPPFNGTRQWTGSNRQLQTTLTETLSSTGLHGDGSTAYGIVAAQSALYSLANWTAMGWFKMPAPLSGNPFFFNLSAGTDATSKWEWLSTAPTVSYRIGNGTSTFSISGAQTALDGTWHHIALTYDGTTAKAYVDGVADGSVAVTGAYTGSADLTVFARTGPGGFGILSVDEVGIYNFAMTQAQVQAKYNSGNGVQGTSGDTGLVAGYHFDEGTGTSAADYSANALNMTLHGTTTWVAGKIVTSANVQTKMDALSFTDGSIANDKGRITLGDANSTTIVQGALVQFDVNGSADSLTFSTDNYLGVNTATPTARLSVNAASASGEAPLLLSLDGTTLLTFTSNAGIQPASGKTLRLKNTGGSDILTIAGGGVVIGAAAATFNAGFNSNDGSSIQPAAAGTVGLIVKGAGSQTADLLDWQDSSANVLAKVDASGNPTFPSVTAGNLTNGQGAAIKNLTELTTIAAAATTDTTLSIPANVLVLGVSVRVITVIPTAATFTVTGATSGTTFNTAAISTAANTTDKGNVAGAYYNTAAQHVRFTPNLTPGAATGQVRVTVHYIDIIPPTS